MIRSREAARRTLAPLGLLLPLSWARSRPPGRLRAACLFLLDLRFRYFVRLFDEAETHYGFRVFGGSTADYIQRRLYVFGFWERDLSEWLKDQLRPGDVFLDVGANIGYFSLLASRVVGPTGNVLAFEAIPSVAQQLEVNLHRNNVGNVTVVRSVVSDVPGLVEVFRGPEDNSGASSTVPGAGFSSEGRVEGVRLDDQPIDASRVRGVKIDVEGDELRVLRGSARLLGEMPPGSWVVAEVSPQRLLERGSSSADLMGFMAGLGFSAWAMPNDYTTLGAARGGITQPLRPITEVLDRQQDVLFRKVG
ncbi:FkbM family methyltransferase [Nocardioides ginsengisegetis]|uniref:FkbM family methyltransferase n=1 Tax=Nocardioides ginsengisegetis TaxID=661491 RepID=A0A7W3PAM5_9ACTN|nr:FkbM family methyltransferase [Nocardioides ginsengisegetis]MBA8804629.1 FkbM family methyltransferase [Nocardioides ginsengisegetis]